MKLGSLKNSSLPDGDPVLVSQNNREAVKIDSIVSSLRVAVETWSEVRPKLELLYQELNNGTLKNTFKVQEEDFHSPLPRSFQWLDGSAFVQHVKLVRKARNAPVPPDLLTVPLMYQGGSDTFLSPREDMTLLDDKFGMDFEGEVAVVTSFVPRGTNAQAALNHIVLVMLVNDVTLRGLVPAELAQGFGFLQSKPSSAFSPFALTLDEFGDSWKNGRLHLPLLVDYNNQFFGDADAGDMHFSFGELIAHAARTRDLTAGTILGSGTVSNEDTKRGSSCLAEKRMLEQINSGEIKTPFMKNGDTIKIEMRKSGVNLFGTIQQKVRKV